MSLKEWMWGDQAGTTGTKYSVGQLFQFWGTDFGHWMIHLLPCCILHLLSTLWLAYPCVSPSEPVAVSGNTANPLSFGSSCKIQPSLQTIEVLVLWKRVDPPRVLIAKTVRFLCAIWLPAAFVHNDFHIRVVFSSLQWSDMARRKISIEKDLYQHWF